MLETHEQNSKKKLITTVLAVVVIAGAVILADALKSKNSTANVASQTAVSNAPEVSISSNAATTSDTSTSTTTSSNSYKDGTYSATSDYFVPHGDESIKVSLTLSSGTITNVSIDNSENDGDSAAYQEEFAGVYKSYVVGKKINGLRLNNVAGASDTTQGFNNALNKIASEAQA